jgi:hypothetical protein
MQTTLEAKTKPKQRSFGETRVRPPEPKSQGETLDQAKRRLVEIQRQAAAHGIQFPALERPALSKVRDEILILERQLASAREPSRMAGQQKARTGQVPNSVEGRMLARARELLGKPMPPRFVTEPAKPTIGETGPTDPRDMDREQLCAAIESEQDPDKRQQFFIALCEREAGKSTREIAEIAAKANDRELEQLITIERDPERRGMLFRELSHRKRK